MADNFWDNIDWGGAAQTVSDVALPALVNYGTNYLMAEEGRKSAEKQFQYMQDKLGEQLSQFDEDFKDEAAGRLSAQEQSSRDTLVNRISLKLDQSYAQQKATIAQQYSRAGIGGDAMSSALTELEGKKNQSLADAVADIDATLLERATNRAMQVKQARLQMLQGINAKLEPLAYASAPVDTSALAVKSLVPGAVAGAVGGVAAGMQGGDIAGSAKAAYSQATYGQALKNAGIDPKMLGQPDQELPKEVGGVIYEPKTVTDFLGNKRTTYEPNEVLTRKAREERQAANVVMTPEQYQKIAREGGTVPKGTRVAPEEKIALETQILDKLVAGATPISTKLYKKYAVYPQDLKQYPDLAQSIVIAEREGIVGWKPIMVDGGKFGKKDDVLSNPLILGTDGSWYEADPKNPGKGKKVKK